MPRTFYAVLLAAPLLALVGTVAAPAAPPEEKPVKPEGSAGSDLAQIRFADGSNFRVSLRARFSCWACASLLL